MDDPHSDIDRLNRTLGQFKIVNTIFTRMHSLLQRVIIADMQTTLHRVATVVDFGCGGGDCMIWLAKRLAKIGLTARILGVDSDPRVVEYARSACRDYPEITVVRGGLEVLGKQYDYVYANHLLHHLPDSMIPHTLQLINHSARRAFFVNDLRRCPAAYLGYTVVAAMIFRNSFAFHDGRLSILRGFTPEEMRGYVNDADLGGVAHVKTYEPARVTVERSGLGLERQADDHRCAWPRLVVHHLHSAVV